MIARHHERGGQEQSPVAIESQERERAEDVKVRLDAAAAQVDEQRRKHHLRDRDAVPRERRARVPVDQDDGRNRQQCARKKRVINVQVGRAQLALPGERRPHERDADREGPLSDQEPGEHAVPARVDRHELAVVKLRRAHRDLYAGLEGHAAHRGPSSREQPYTAPLATSADANAFGTGALVSSASNASNRCRAGLSPSWPRAGVMPPLNVSVPARS